MAKTYMLAEAEKKIDKLEAQLAIAVKGLKKVHVSGDIMSYSAVNSVIGKALADIKAVKGEK